MTGKEANQTLSMKSDLIMALNILSAPDIMTDLNLHLLFVISL